MFSFESPERKAKILWILLRNLFFIYKLSLISKTNHSIFFTYCFLSNFISLAKYPLSLLQKSYFICYLFYPDSECVPRNKKVSIISTNVRIYIIICSYFSQYESDLEHYCKNSSIEIILNFHRTFQMNFVNGNFVKPQYDQISKMMWVVVFLLPLYSKLKLNSMSSLTGKTSSHSSFLSGTYFSFKVVLKHHLNELWKTAVTELMTLNIYQYNIVLLTVK